MAPGRCALTAGGTPPPAVPGAGPPVAGPPVAVRLRAGGVERRWRVPVAAGRGVKGRTGVRAGNRERRWRSGRVRRWRGCREGGSGRVSRDAYIYIYRGEPASARLHITHQATAYTSRMYVGAAGPERIFSARHRAPTAEARRAPLGRKPARAARHRPVGMLPQRQPPSPWRLPLPRAPRRPPMPPPP